MAGHANADADGDAAATAGLLAAAAARRTAARADRAMVGAASDLVGGGRGSQWRLPPWRAVTKPAASTGRRDAVALAGATATRVRRRKSRPAEADVIFGARRWGGWTPTLTRKAMRTREDARVTTAGRSKRMGQLGDVSGKVENGGDLAMQVAW